MERAVPQSRISLDTFKPLFHPKPYTGKLWVDLIFLLLLGALHSTVIPSIIGRYLSFDLMTPWLICTFVAAPLTHSVIVLMVASFILETHSACPAGMYMTAYWIIMAVIWLTRATLSWRHAFPWTVTMVVAQLWVILFEAFVKAVTAGTVHISFFDVWCQALRLITGTLFGMGLAQRFLREGLGEESS
jgi:hypothetical protein